MFKEHPACDAPKNANKIIWRYMSLSKYISLLSTSTLFFSRADKFEDSFEGSSTVPTQSLIKEHFKREISKGINVNQQYLDILRYTRKDSFINCWHMNDYESLAMWDIYTNNGEGIAIQSTYRSLCDSINEYNEDVNIGKVKYIDYNSALIPMLYTINPLLYKRISYAHENELRAIVQYIKSRCNFNLADIPNIDMGINVKVVLEKLINNVYVAPQSDPWFKEIIESINGKYGLDVKVVNSRLDDKPIY
jgi:hypothetical protein